MTFRRRIPQEVELNSRSLLHRCRASVHGKTEIENDDLLATLAGNPTGLSAEPTRNASNSTQLGYDTHAALDNPSGCALFQGVPGGASKQ